MDCQWMKLIHQPTSTRQVSKKWPQNRRTCYDEDDCFCPEQKCQDCLLEGFTQESCDFSHGRFNTALNLFVHWIKFRQKSPIILKIW